MATGNRLSLDSINESLANGTITPDWKSDDGNLDYNIEYRMNHSSCPAGEDTRGRLYAKMTQEGTTLYYCHNCGGSRVTRNYHAYRNYRDIFDQQYDNADDDSKDKNGKRSSWERDGFRRMYQNAWDFPHYGDVEEVVLTGISNKILSKYRIRGWYFDGDTSAGHGYFGGFRRDTCEYEWREGPDSDSPIIQGLRLYFPVFHPDSGDITMLSVKQVAVHKYPASDGNQRVKLPDSEWKWKHFVYTAGGRVAPIVDNPGQKTCILVEDRISSLLLQTLSNEAVTTVCLNGTHLREEHAFALATNPTYNQIVVWLDNDSEVVRQKAYDMKKQLEFFAGGKKTLWVCAGRDPKIEIDEDTKAQLEIALR